ncbi:UDP-glycosyltransferase 75C1-like [Cornus florida]|uniref:UDP-glycosyltransferase 75C1-like n=1 Tax=Cornus florida TaxID=4283 RepID=UPI0028970153|nr:UDP-glycosyltransferase 75C1-like [Cornus florida]
MVDCHILLLPSPGQGHINPSIQFANKLIGMGVKVTILTNLYVHRRITKSNSLIPKGLSLSAFSDGYDDGIKDGDNREHFQSQYKICGSKAVAELIKASDEEGCPITCLVYTMNQAWAAEVARAHHIPSAVLWTQPAMVLDIYYYYFNGYGDAIRKFVNDVPSSSIQLPGLPLLASTRDLPSFLLPNHTNVHDFLPEFKHQIDILDAETNPQVLVNTFDALESDALRAIKKLNMIPIGPLIPSVFLEGKDPSDTSFGGDMIQKSADYVEWLDSKPESSVVYISFGSFSVLSKKQKEEMAHVLLESRRPFLWVVRKTDQFGEDIEDKSSCMEELEKQGMIVPWCSQVEVLSHPSLGCFITHCGWNSTLESLVSGVPMVAFPQWTDQGSNAKLITDVWETGVRVTVNEEGIAEREELKRCIEMVMGDGEKGKEMRINAKKWKELGRGAVKEGGSSDMNLKAFVSELGN